MISKITAIIVDDELSARENLRYLLKNYCPNITIASEASNVDNAIIEIKKHKPHLVFLDIEMPQKNGFQLLESFNPVNFQIVFVTAYDKYAIKAFQVAALDYLLKPIDIDRLKEVEQKINNVTHTNSKRLQLLIDNKKQITKIAIPYKNDYVIINMEDIICIRADRMYSIIYTKKNKQYIAAKKLTYYENLFESVKNFMRLHRSWIVNTKYIETYSKREKHVVLNNKVSIPVSKTYKLCFENTFTS